MNVLIIHEFLITEFLVFWTTVPVSRGFDIMPKLRECVQNKSKTLFRIASHFWTNIEYSRRVLTSIFVEMILWELTPEAEYEFCVSKHPDFIYAHARKFPQPQSQNYYWNRLTFLNKDLQFSEGLDKFFLGNSRIISDGGVCSILKTLPGCRVSRHNVFHFPLHGTFSKRVK